VICKETKSEMKENGKEEGKWKILRMKG